MEKELLLNAMVDNVTVEYLHVSLMMIQMQ
jgi:hypothetical protein